MISNWRDVLCWPVEFQLNYHIKWVPAVDSNFQPFQELLIINFRPKTIHLNWNKKRNQKEKRNEKKAKMHKTEKLINKIEKKQKRIIKWASKMLNSNAVKYLGLICAICSITYKYVNKSTKKKRTSCTSRLCVFVYAWMCTNEAIKEDEEKKKWFY